MSLTRAKWEAMLVEYLDKPESMQQALYENAPLLGMLPKVKRGGLQTRTPVLKMGNRNRSATYATAIAKTADTEAVAFTTTKVDNFGYLQIVDNAILDSATDAADAALEALKSEFEAAMVGLRKDLGQGCFGNVGGSKSQVATTATVASATLILKNKEDAIFFDIGDTIEASANDGTDAGHALRVGSAVISAVNYSLGTITTAGGNWSTQITALATTDYLFHAGDFKLKMSGLSGWIPDATPTSTAYFGVNRLLHPVRFAGARFAAGGMPREDAIKKFVAEMMMYGAEPDLIVMNPIAWVDLEMSVSKDRIFTVNPTDASGKKVAQIAFDAIAVPTGKGRIPVISDPNLKKNRAYVLSKGSWKVEYAGDDLAHWQSEDGLRIRRVASADAWEGTIKSRAQMICNAPWQNGVMLLDATTVS